MRAYALSMVLLALSFQAGAEPATTVPSDNSAPKKTVPLKLESKDLHAVTRELHATSLEIKSVVEDNHGDDKAAEKSR